MDLKAVFEGVRVIELAQYVFVPGASVLLADHGAEVIHVETPGAGDPYRTLRVGISRDLGGVNLAMEQNNRGKKSIALDLKTEEGREAFLRLIETADIFITSLRPRAIQALRLDVEDLRARNPAIIYTRGNGLGFRGQEANKPGFDASAFYARGGMCYAMTPPGAQPPPPRPAMGDHIGSLGLAFGMASALYKRAVTGEPSVVETSLLSTAAWVLSGDITLSQIPEYKVHGMAKRSPLKYTYTTRDGRLVMLMLLDPQLHWPLFCQMVGLEEITDDPRFAEEEDRIENCEILVEIIQGQIGKRDWSHWKPLFENWDAPWELIRSIHDVAADPQARANDMIVSLAVGGQQVSLVAGPTAFDGRTTTVDLEASPELGSHTDELLLAAGYSNDAIADMRARGIAQ